MSEFSESYHLFTRNQSDAINLIKASGLHGYVSESMTGWVSFVVSESKFKPNPRVIEKSQLPLLHFVNAEDHGWSFFLFDATKPVCQYQSSWNDDIEFDMTGFRLAAIERVLGKCISDRVSAMLPQFTPASFDEYLEHETPYEFAQALGLPHYEWFCYNGVSNVIKIPGERYAAFVEVKS